MRIISSFSAIFLLASLLLAAPPTVGTPTVVSGTLTSTSVQLTFTVSATSYCWAEYDTNTGAPYTYSAPGLDYTNTANCRVTLANLTPGTLYYVRASGRPNSNNSTDIGYASEMTFTTNAASYPAPALPTTWALSTYPDTTGYTVVTLTPSGSGDDNCGIQAAIDTMVSLGADAFARIVEIPQGAVCNNLGVHGGSPTGFALPILPVATGYTLNDPDHPWIIIRTARTPALTPPDGTRVTSEYVGTLAKINQTGPGVGGCFYADWFTGIAHHFWVDSIECTWTNNTTADSQGPTPYAQSFFSLANTATTNYGHYIVLDRWYSVPHDPPFRVGLPAQIQLEGAYLAMINSHIEGAYWKEYVNTLPDTTYLGNTITQLAGAWQRKPADATWTIGSTVTAAGTLSGGYAGTYAMYLNGSGVTLEYTTPAGMETASWVCTGCTATPVATPAVPDSAHKLATGTITAGAIASISSFGCGFSCEGSFGIYSSNGPGPIKWLNNYVDNPGQTAYTEVLGNGAQLNDVTFQGNEILINPKYQITGPASNGWYYTNRLIWETKRGYRWLINGNRFSGNFGNLTSSCASIVWSTRYAETTTGAGIGDQTFTNNTVSDSCGGMYFGGLSENGGGTFTDGPILARLKASNNVFNNIDGLSYTTTTTDIDFANRGQMWTTFMGFDQLEISRNNWRRARGQYPPMFFYRGTSANLRLWNNVLSMSAGASTAVTAFTANDTQWLSNFPANPYVVSSANFTTTLAGSSGGYSVLRNAIVGGTIRDGAYPGTIDLTGAQMTSICSTFPGTGNTCVAGETQAARETAIGMVDSGFLKLTSPYLSASADARAISDASGYAANFRIGLTASAVNVRMRRASTSAVACTLAWSTDGGVTWPAANQVLATGSGVEQIATFAASSNTVYAIRPICPQGIVATWNVLTPAV